MENEGQPFRAVRQADTGAIGHDKIGNSASATVVRKAMTLAPAALPAQIPAGTSSTTMHSGPVKPSFAAAFKNGSGCGLPIVTSVEVTSPQEPATRPRAAELRPAAACRKSRSSSVSPEAAAAIRALREGYDSVCILYLAMLYLLVFRCVISIR